MENKKATKIRFEGETFDIKDANAHNRLDTVEATYAKVSDIEAKKLALEGQIATAVAIAEGKTKADTFDTYDDMVAKLKATGQDAYNLGDILYIKAKDVPDYWISGVLVTPNETDGGFGYFEISEMETAKVDLDKYVDKANEQTIEGTKTFKGGIILEHENGEGKTVRTRMTAGGFIHKRADQEESAQVAYYLPTNKNTAQTLAMLSDIPVVGIEEQDNGDYTLVFE